MPELFELSQKFLLDRKRVGREQPILFREETFFREGFADDVDLIVLNLHYEANVQRPTSNVQYRMQTSRFDIRRSAFSVYLPAAIFFSASFTSSSADLA